LTQLQSGTIETKHLEDDRAIFPLYYPPQHHSKCAAAGRAGVLEEQLARSL
jgi:hypothetical protein